MSDNRTADDTKSYYQDDVICPHKERCTDYPNLCGTCRNNKGRRSYYEQGVIAEPKPEPYPWWSHPYYPNDYYYNRGR